MHITYYHHHYNDLWAYRPALFCIFSTPYQGFGRLVREVKKKQKNQNIPKNKENIFVQLRKKVFCNIWKNYAGAWIYFSDGN